MSKPIFKIPLILAVLIAVAICLYFIPPIHSRILPRLELLRLRIVYAFDPPKDVVFIPTQQVLSQTATPQASPVESATTIPTGGATPTGTPPPLPDRVVLSNVPYVNQCNRWNYCGPANLAMALQYWGWQGTRDDIAAVVKPGENNPSLDFIQAGHSDVNVMPYELVDYVQDHTQYRALTRYGGTIDLLRRLIAAGFPVVTENGLVSTDSAGHTAWSGHFAFATGYDDGAQSLIWQDSYPNACQGDTYKLGHNVASKYSDFLGLWRDFDFVFIVVYPADREADLFKALGPWSDYNWAAQSALDTNNQDIQTLTGDDLFFAYFDKGTSLVALYQYGDAAAAYDYAYGSLYPSLPKDTHQPYRIMWYQTGPYWAYYYTSRYQDVIDLANANLTNKIFAPETLEESLYWRALAENALKEYGAAVADIQKAYYYNRNMKVILDVMQQWGVSP